MTHRAGLTGLLQQLGWLWDHLGLSLPDWLLRPIGAVLAVLVLVELVLAIVEDFPGTGHRSNNAKRRILDASYSCPVLGRRLRQGAIPCLRRRHK
jgi:hypothetical protein